MPRPLPTREDMMWSRIWVYVSIPVLGWGCYVGFANEDLFLIVGTLIMIPFVLITHREVLTRRKYVHLHT